MARAEADTSSVLMERCLSAARNPLTASSTRRFTTAASASRALTDRLTCAESGLADTLPSPFATTCGASGNGVPARAGWIDIEMSIAQTAIIGVIVEYGRIGTPLLMDGAMLNQVRCSRARYSALCISIRREAVRSKACARRSPAYRSTGDAFALQTRLTWRS